MPNVVSHNSSWSVTKLMESNFYVSWMPEIGKSIVWLISCQQSYSFFRAVKSDQKKNQNKVINFKQTNQNLWQSVFLTFFAAENWLDLTFLSSTLWQFGKNHSIQLRETECSAIFCAHSVIFDLMIDWRGLFRHSCALFGKPTVARWKHS